MIQVEAACAAVIVDAEVPGHGYAARGGCDREVRSGDQCGGIADVAIRLHGTGDDAIIAGRARHEGARHLHDIEVVQIAGEVELCEIQNGGGAGEGAAERREVQAGKRDAAGIGVEGGFEAGARDA